MKSLDIPFLKGEVVRLEGKLEDTVKSVQQISGALFYARNLLAHAEKEAGIEANRQAQATDVKPPETPAGEAPPVEAPPSEQIAA